MPRKFKLLLAALLAAVTIGGIYLYFLRQRVERLAEPQQTEEQARREVTEEPVESPAADPSRARIYWASTARPGELQAVEVELALPERPAQRARQVLNALIVDAPSPAQRTLPLELTVLAFYLLPDGTAVADFSHALATATPSGILSEQMAVDSIARTVAANVPGARRLKILIQGQEAETVAGHVDLSGMIDLRGARAAGAR